MLNEKFTSAGFNQIEFARSIRKALSENLYFSHFKMGKGYATIALVKHPEEMLTAWYISFCAPGDQFDRWTGRALSREGLFLGLSDPSLVNQKCMISYAEDIYLLPRHEACELALQTQLQWKRPSFFNRRKDVIEPLTRGRTKKRLGNLKTEEIQ